MSRHNVSLVIHVGYPKTATTTFQKHVFPRHPEIEYLGKLIPSFRYVDEALYGVMDELLHRSPLHFSGVDRLRTCVEGVRERTSKKCVLISSESCIHPSVIDIATVADRLRAALHPCKILITIREQISAILSFYWMHGRYGQYLTIGPKEDDDQIRYPIPFSDWIQFQKTAEDRNYLGTLHYDLVVGYYMQKFDGENVRVLLYESLKADPDGYTRDLGNFLGVDAQALRNLLRNKHEYRSEGRSTPWEERHANILTAGAETPDFFRRVSQFFKRRIDMTDSEVEKEITELRETYRGGNERLAKMLSIPLKEYGYAV